MAAEPPTVSRLEVGHVLFLDIVGYSKLLSDKQRKVFQLLKDIVRGTSQFRSAEAANKLVRIPTGDGMVLAFFTSVDAPVRCALEISRKLREHPELKLRGSGLRCQRAAQHHRSGDQYGAAADGLRRCRTHSSLPARGR